jgi:FKBP-type peptidyl-prolyl cis-trans isomerase 2
MQMQAVRLGDRVRVEYTRIKQRAGAAAQATEPKVLEFTVGGNEVMPGLSVGVVGMAQGDEKHMTLQPAEAYGPVKPGLIKEIPRHQFPKHIVLRVGKRLTALGGTSGRRRRVRVVKINPRSILVDGNHLLAGQVVELQVRLISRDCPAAANGSRSRRQSENES